MRVRRLRKEPAALEITAFLNLIVVLVPFLLSTAVFTRLAVLDLSLPPPASGVEQLKTNDLQLEVVIRKDALEVGDRLGGLIQRIGATPNGHDFRALGQLAQQIKLKFADKTSASVLAEPDTPYEQVVQAMDALRSASAGKGAQTELFPDIMVGDAPVMRIATANAKAKP